MHGIEAKGICLDCDIIFSTCVVTAWVGEAFPMGEMESCSHEGEVGVETRRLRPC